MKRNQIIKKIIIMILLFIFYSYIVALQNIPSDIVIFEGETLNIKTIFGITANLKLNDGSIETISNNQSKIKENSGNPKIELSVFKNIVFKNINVDVLPKTTVIPVGNIAGIKLYTSGVLVVGMSEIEGIDNLKYRPYENTGINEGDTIISVNDTSIENTEDLKELVNKSKGKEVKIKYLHNENTVECSIKPIKVNASEYKLGLWVRDSSARSWYSHIL